MNSLLPMDGPFSACVSYLNLVKLVLKRIEMHVFHISSIYNPITDLYNGLKGDLSVSQMPGCGPHAHHENRIPV